MWKYIKSQTDAVDFMEMMGYFHDSCIKEIKYKSGAYVNEDFSMYPINDCRILSVAIQSQLNGLGMIELEFTGLKWMKLCPTDEAYTCEILDATLSVKEDGIYWCDCGDISDFEAYSGTVLCAKGLRWRTVKDHIGKADYYIPQDKTGNNTIIAEEQRQGTVCVNPNEKLR